MHQHMFQQLAVFSQGGFSVGQLLKQRLLRHSSAFNSAEGCLVGDRVGQVNISHILIVTRCWHQLLHI